MVSKKDSERYNNLRIARTLDLLHYFGNEWVDLKSVKIEKSPLRTGSVTSPEKISNLPNEESFMTT